MSARRAEPVRMWIMFPVTTTGWWKKRDPRTIEPISGWDPPDIPNWEKPGDQGVGASGQLPSGS